MAIRQILWDWNGTLLNDVQYAVDVRNRVFPAFGLPTLDSVERYHEQFTFPVKLYYDRAGVTDDIFDAVAHAWMDEYVRGAAGVPLHADALEVLARFRAAGLRQVILTASPVDVIARQLSYYPLEGFFHAVLGLDNIYAGSKEAIGCAYLARSPVAAAQTLMIGDSLHDAEVARAMGAACALVSRGHQSERTLREAGVPVYGSLAQVADWALAEER